MSILRIIEILLGLAMITCAIFLGISTYKTHFRKKPTGKPVDSESSSQDALDAKPSE